MSFSLPKFFGKCMDQAVAHESAAFVLIPEHILQAACRAKAQRLFPFSTPAQTDAAERHFQRAFEEAAQEPANADSHLLSEFLLQVDLAHFDVAFGCLHQATEVYLEILSTDAGAHSKSAQFESVIAAVVERIEILQQYNAVLNELKMRSNQFQALQLFEAADQPAEAAGPTISPSFGHDHPVSALQGQQYRHAVPLIASPPPPYDHAVRRAISANPPPADRAPCDCCDRGLGLSPAVEPQSTSSLVAPTTPGGPARRPAVLSPTSPGIFSSFFHTIARPIYQSLSGYRGHRAQCPCLFDGACLPSSRHPTAAAPGPVPAPPAPAYQEDRRVTFSEFTDAYFSGRHNAKAGHFAGPVATPPNSGTADGTTKAASLASCEPDPTLGPPGQVVAAARQLLLQLLLLVQYSWDLSVTWVDQHLLIPSVAGLDAAQSAGPLRWTSSTWRRVQQSYAHRQNYFILQGGRGSSFGGDGAPPLGPCSDIEVLRSAHALPDSFYVYADPGASFIDSALWRAVDLLARVRRALRALDDSPST
ncbi:hypothetical protein H696_04557 [Fonticula alba]|uniref:Uncharacterized protein n=1 Tax=Fonticula alba TaxID=691883 RepID=A0A058Z6I6_FONAL|nr:hypothetical protein H696_04557 [Fonticula alba]KCV69142.1 hypothetical protein H696_04557 [Fonticula alba]|eukprot:XP_009496713.1 hypothetical protein H696_04557 [Fonticula alba]